jgi:hypothetical protein
MVTTMAYVTESVTVQAPKGALCWFCNEREASRPNAVTVELHKALFADPYIAVVAGRSFQVPRCHTCAYGAARPQRLGCLGTLAGALAGAVPLLLGVESLTLILLGLVVGTLAGMVLGVILGFRVELAHSSQPTGRDANAWPPVARAIKEGFKRGKVDPFFFAAVVFPERSPTIEADDAL